MSRKSIPLLTASVALVAGCGGHSDVPAIRTSTPSTPNTLTVSADTTVDTGIATAIRAHLTHNSNLNPNAFDTEVKRVTMDGDHAQAEVEFHVKNGPGVMQLTYALVRQNGAWSVVESTPKGSNFSHPQVNGTPAAQPGTASSSDRSIFRAMDNFHAGATPAQELPAGHPPVKPTQTSDPAKAP